MFIHEVYIFLGIPGGSESGPVNSPDMESRPMNWPGDKENLGDEENDGPSSQREQEKVPMKRPRWTPVRVRMSAEDYYMKMTKLQEEKLEEMRRHNYAMEELTRQKLDELKRHHLELERQTANTASGSVDVSNTFTGTLSEYDPQMSYTSL